MQLRLLHLISLVLVSTVSGLVVAETTTEMLLQQSYEQTTAGNFDGALSTLEQAAEQDPNSSLVHTRLGGVRLLRKEYSNGIKDFQQAIMLDQRNAAAFIGMAVAYLHLGQYKLAEASLSEAGKLDPSKQQQIDQVLAWIEQRSSGMSASAH